VRRVQGAAGTLPARRSSSAAEEALQWRHDGHNAEGSNIMVSVVYCILMQGLPAVGAPVPEGAMPISTTGPWSVRVGPGTVTLKKRQISIHEPVELQVPQTKTVQVRDELHPALPLFNHNAGSWQRGAKLQQLVTEECEATGLVVPDSIRVKPAAGEAPPYVEGKDYIKDAFWAQVGRIEGGAIAEDQQVFVDYDWVPSRLDSIVVDAQGNVRLVLGKPGKGSQPPPDLAEGETAVANLWIPGRTETLTDQNLFPIEPDQPIQTTPPVAERLLPKTLAKLRAGQDVKIVAWGDSVTAGGGVGEDQSLWYQYRFAQALRQRFPKANITMLTAAWPGGNSVGYMSAPPGGQYDFVRDVLEPKPDLVTIEFVNDAGLGEEGTAPQYAKILQQLRGIGAEVILITPHLVRPDWMGVDTLKFDDDPRPYVKELRKFGEANNVAVADASKLWCHLWREGIPYVTLEANSINHPDERGHGLFVDALMALFPER
jgi:lysophospholipase L1-like esterase